MLYSQDRWNKIIGLLKVHNMPSINLTCIATLIFL